MHILAVEREHPNMATSQTQVVNDPQATTFSAPCGGLSDFPYAPGARNDLPGLRMFVQIRLQLPVSVVIEISIETFGKERGLDEFEHLAMLRHCRSRV